MGRRAPARPDARADAGRTPASGGPLHRQWRVQDRLWHTLSLVAPFQVEMPSQSGYYLVYPRSRAQDPKIEAFHSWLFGTVDAGHPERPAMLETV